MEPASDPARTSLPTPAEMTGDDEPEPEPARHAGPIEDHHFQRPIVSPVASSGVRTTPRGG
jgi:hypothetical protein